MQEYGIQRAVQQAARLRASLVRTARALHGACQEVAGQNDPLAANPRRPGAADHRSSAERWRAVADQALVAADTWDEDQDLHSALACPSCSRLLPWGVLLSAGSSSTSRVLQCPACGTFACVQAVPVESLGRAQRPSVGRVDAVQDRSSLVDALDTIVAGRLFTVGLRLHEAASLTDGELRSRLELAVRDLDECVDEVRRVALHLAV